MTPLYLVVAWVLSAILLAMWVGAAVRCRQEGFAPIISVIVFLVIPIYLVLCLLCPIIAASHVLSSDDWRMVPLGKRIMWSLVAIPTAIVILIGSFNELTNATFWASISEANQIFLAYKAELTRSEDAKQILRVLRAEGLKSLGQSLNFVNDRVFNLCMTTTF